MEKSKLSRRRFEMRIIDGFHGARGCFEDGRFCKARWDAYIDSLSPMRKLLEADAASYVFEKDVLPVLERVPLEENRLSVLHNSFCKVTAGLEERIRSAVGFLPECDVILYLGLCNGAGWATAVEGRKVILLGIEKIVELGWTDERAMAGLIYHELGHLWHFALREAETYGDSPASRGLWQLYTEGVAMYFEQLLWGDSDFFHQDRNGWLGWCKNNQSRLFREYLRRVEEGESVQDFFGDWCAFEEHSDVGYYLGAVLVHRLAERLGPEGMLQASSGDVLGELRVLTYE